MVHLVEGPINQRDGAACTPLHSMTIVTPLCLWLFQLQPYRVHTDKLSDLGMLDADR